MSSITSYKTTAFKESQKFLVVDPSTQSPSLVLGSDLVSYITPMLNYVRADSTRLSAENTDYDVGTLVQTSGATAPGDSLASTYLVVEGGTGDFPMLNGNDLLVVTGDDGLRAQLAEDVSTGNGANLVNGATIYVGSVAELEALPNPAEGQEAMVSGFSFEYSGGSWRPSMYVSPDCFGAAGDGIADDTSPIQDAFDYADLNGVSVIFRDGAIYLVTAPIDIHNVSTLNDGLRRVTIKAEIPAADTGAFTSSESLDFCSIKGLFFDTSGCGDGVSAIDAKYGAIRSFFSVNVDGGAIKTGGHGIRIRGVNPDDGLGNNQNYNNHFEDCDIRQCDIGIFLDGADIINARINSNTIVSGRIGACNNNIYINGQMNVVKNVTLNPPASGRSIVLEGDQSFNLVVIGCYFDNQASPDMIYLNATSNITPLTLIDSIGIQDDNITNTNNDSPIVTILRGRVRMGSVDIPSAGDYSLAGDKGDKFFWLKGNPTLSGSLLLGTAARASGNNALAPRGSVSVSIQDSVDAKYRIVKTGNDANFDVLYSVDNSGKHSYTETPTQTTVGGAGVASALPSNPSGYLEVEINGVNRVIPYFNP